MSETKSRIQLYVEAQCADVISAAEVKLGRDLSAEEKASIHNLGAMMLESCLMSFSHETTTSEEVARDLAFFVSQHGPGPSQSAA